jgi:DNA-binding GntR family transcriptional regulator
MENESLVKAFQVLAKQSMLNTSYLNVIMKYQAQIVAHIQNRDFDEVVSEMDDELDHMMKYLQNLASDEESNGQ